MPPNLVIRWDEGALESACYLPGMRLQTAFAASLALVAVTSDVAVANPPAKVAAQIDPRIVALTERVDAQELRIKALEAALASKMGPVPGYRDVPFEGPVR